MRTGLCEDRVGRGQWWWSTDLGEYWGRTRGGPGVEVRRLLRPVLPQESRKSRTANEVADESGLWRRFRDTGLDHPT